MYLMYPGYEFFSINFIFVSLVLVCIELLDLCQVAVFYSCSSCIQKAFVSCDVKKGYQSFVLI